MRGNPHAAFDEAGAGNAAWSRWCDTRRRKSEPTGNTNFDLNRRASLQPYQRGAEGEIPSVYSPTWRSRFNELRHRGVPKFNAAVAAGSPTGFWRMSGHPAVQQALRNHYFDSLGLPRIFMPVPV